DRRDGGFEQLLTFFVDGHGGGASAGGGGGERLYSTTRVPEVKAGSGQILVACWHADLGVARTARARGWNPGRVFPRGDPPPCVPASIRAEAGREGLPRDGRRSRDRA